MPRVRHDVPGRWGDFTSCNKEPRNVTDKTKTSTKHRVHEARHKPREALKRREASHLESGHVHQKGTFSIVDNFRLGE